MTHLDDVLNFWFADGAKEGTDLAPHLARWFGRDAKLDRLIGDRFGGDIERAARGQFNDWKATARGRLALIVMLDQFPRNAFRNNSKAFAFDARAAEVCLEGLATNADLQLAPVERLFFYLPLLHSEIRADQKRSVALFRRLAAEKGPLSATFREWLRLARRHHLIISIFGRFPHRNAILERQTTVAERFFLLSGSLMRSAHPKRT